MKKRALLSITWLLILCCAFACKSFSQNENFLSKKEKQQGWQVLFSGVNTYGWQTPTGKPVPAGWEIRNGILTAKKGLEGGDIVTVNQYSDLSQILTYNQVETAG